MKFEVITKNFENALVRYKVACQKDWQFVVKQQSRIVGEKLIKFTPPKTASIGKRNVARDIGKVFADLSGTTWEDKSAQLGKINRSIKCGKRAILRE